MKDFAGKIAVVTGAGTGIGRELALQLSSAGAHVAGCDVIDENLAETRSLCEAAAPEGTRFSSHHCDVADEAQVEAFAQAVRSEHQTEHINLLFNNAGLGGAGAFLDGDREQWDKVFDVCWGGVYYGCRHFLSMLAASDEGRVVNVSSVNGFWASLGPHVSHTAYSAAK